MKLFKKDILLNKLKAMARDRRGLGMELAMMVLLVALGCSMLMVSSAMRSRDALLEQDQELRLRLELDEFVESGFTVNDDKFDYAKNDNIYTVTLSGDSPTVLLKFEIDDTNKITSWTYINPETGE